jgi:hypothetical protein
VPVFVRSAVAVIFSALVAVAQTHPPASEWLPDGAIYAVRLDRPAVFLELATQLKV